MGIIFIILIPVVSAISMFVAGAVWAIIYNFAAGRVGGVRIVLEQAA